MQEASEISSTIAAIQSLKESDWWKYIVEQLSKTKDSIIEQILTPRTDQRLQFSADHILKERIEVINLILDLPKISLNDLDNKLFAMTQHAKPTEQRIEEYNENFKQELQNRWLLR